MRRASAVMRVAIGSVALAAALAGCGDGGDPPAGAQGVPASLSPAVSTSATPTGAAAAGTFTVSGAGVARSHFGAVEERVMAAVSDRLGDPDLTTAPRSYQRIDGHRGWFEVAGDPISPSWRYRVTSAACWDALCVIFGGRDADSLRLRGWVLARPDSAPTAAATPSSSRPDVRLAGSGLGLGASWKALQAAYPRVIPAGGEGASLTVRQLPWSGVSDGVGAWRLSGQWDYAHPSRVPAGARVTRLSGGEGPEPGCC